VTEISKSVRSPSPEFSLCEPLPIIPKGDPNSESKFYKLEPQSKMVASDCFKNNISPEEYFLQYPMVKRGAAGKRASELVTPVFNTLTPVEEIAEDEGMPESIFKTNPSIIPSLKDQSFKSKIVRKSTTF
jgi:hypothetical protein